jgi:hypothetical protein
MWNGMRTMLAIGARGHKWSYIFAFWTGVLTLTLPVFFLALFLNKGPLQLPPKLQRVTVTAAVFTGLIAAIELITSGAFSARYWRNLKASIGARERMRLSIP